MKKVDFYFDYLSPYSYFAWKNHKKIDADFNYRPVAMGSLFSHWGITGPGEILPKRIHMLKNCFEYASLNDIKFIPPKDHPFNPLYALRLSTVAMQIDQFKVIDLLFEAVWGRGEDLSDTDLLVSLLKENGFESADELLEKTFEKEVKSELKQNLKEAKERMIFGVPSFISADELFWGNDSLAALQRQLNGDSPAWDKELYKSRLQLD